MNRRALTLAVTVPLAAAILGNAFIPESAMTWYGELRHPWFKLPLWGSIVVALLVYLGYGVIIFRTFSKHLGTAVVLSAAVVIGNEVWNLFFFGTHNLGLTFWLTCGFAVLVFVQSVSIGRRDKLSFGISLVYLAWVVVYDLPWLYRLSITNA